MDDVSTPPPKSLGRSPGSKKTRVAPAPPPNSGASPSLRKSSSAAVLKRSAWGTPDSSRPPRPSTALTPDAFTYDLGLSSSYDPGLGLGLGDSYSPGLGEVQMGVAHLVLDKKRLEQQLFQTEEDLRKANKRIDQHVLQIKTLQGRQTAVRVSSAEASLKGESWSIADVKRFTSVPKSKAEFTSDVLRELLDQALLGTTRRVLEAVQEGVAARAESVSAEGEGEESIEKVLAKCKGLTADVEYAVRQAVLGILNRGNRLAKRLRTALHALEAAATAAQDVHASDLRQVTTRLVAVRDAQTAMVLNDLAKTEHEGHNSIRGLHSRILEKDRVILERDAEIVRLRTELELMCQLLKEEKRQRAVDSQDLRCCMRVVQREIPMIEREVNLAQRDRKINPIALARDLSLEEKEREDERRAFQQRFERQAKEQAAKIVEYERRLMAMRADARATLEAMNGRLKTLMSENVALEAQHEEDLAVAENAHERERSFLNRKAEKLHSQVRALKASTTRGRALFYWSSMKKTFLANPKVADHFLASGEKWSGPASDLISERLKDELGRDEALDGALEQAARVRIGERVLLAEAAGEEWLAEEWRTPLKSAQDTSGGVHRQEWLAEEWRTPLKSGIPGAHGDPAGRTLVR